jgi:hypothetical protein
MKGKDAQANKNSVFSDEELAQFDEDALQGFRAQSMLTPESSAMVSNSKNPKGVVLSDGMLVSSRIFKTGIGRREKS